MEDVKRCPMCGRYSMRYAGKKGVILPNGKDILIYACENRDCKYVENVPEE